MRVDIFTIFPGVFSSPLKESLLGRAIDAGILDVRLHDIRDFTEDAHRQVDDEPFGGGPGMVMKPEPMFAAVESLGADRGRTLILSPGDGGWIKRSSASSPASLRSSSSAAGTKASTSGWSRDSRPRS